MKPANIRDNDLLLNILADVADGEVAKFSNFLPVFERQMNLPPKGIPKNYWHGRIRAVLAQMFEQSLIDLHYSKTEDTLNEIFDVASTRDFGFRITDIGRDELKNFKSYRSNETPERTKPEENKSFNQTPINQLIAEYDYPKPRNIKTAKERIAHAIATRRGQKEFRERLIRYYKGCLITGCNVENVLEAAHIQPYSEGGTFELSNGLLLRADIHTLFDLGLIAIDSSNMTLILSQSLKREELYKTLDGKTLLFPAGTEDTPNKTALNEHRKNANL